MNKLIIPDLQQMLKERATKAKETLSEQLVCATKLLELKRDLADNSSYPTDHYGELTRPQIILGIWGDSSATPYTEALDFRCGTWQESASANSIEEIEENGLLNLNEVKGHCEGKIDFSKWISCSDEVACIF